MFLQREILNYKRKHNFKEVPQRFYISAPQEFYSTSCQCAIYKPSKSGTDLSYVKGVMPRRSGGWMEVYVGNWEVLGVHQEGWHSCALVEGEIFFWNAYEPSSSEKEAWTNQVQIGEIAGETQRAFNAGQAVALAGKIS